MWFLINISIKYLVREKEFVILKKETIISNWKTLHVGHTISFQTSFVWAFKIIIDSWKFSILLLYILWDDWPIFIISFSNQQLQQQLEYILLKPNCHSWWISKMQSGREDILEKWYAIRLF